MKTKLLFFILLAMLTFHGCTNSSDPEVILYEDNAGKLIWGGSPAVDGTGLLFESGDKTYGVEGDKSDYDDIFSNDENNVTVIADFLLTKEKTVRGWGATFTKIEILKVRRVDSSLE